MAYEKECNYILKGLLNSRIEGGNKIGIQVYMVGFYCQVALNEDNSTFKIDHNIEEICLAILKTDKYISISNNAHNQKMVSITDSGIAFITKGGYTEKLLPRDNKDNQDDTNRVYDNILHQLWVKKIDKFHTARQLYRKVKDFRRRWQFHEFVNYLEELEQIEKNKIEAVITVNGIKHTARPPSNIDVTNKNGVTRYRISQDAKDRIEADREKNPHVLKYTGTKTMPAWYKIIIEYWKLIVTGTIAATLGGLMLWWLLQT